jgi:hypothetical protein
MLSRCAEIHASILNPKHIVIEPGAKSTQDIDLGLFLDLSLKGEYAVQVERRRFRRKGDPMTPLTPKRRSDSSCNEWGWMMVGSIQVPFLKSLVLSKFAWLDIQCIELNENPVSGNYGTPLVREADYTDK